MLSCQNAQFQRFRPGFLAPYATGSNPEQLTDTEADISLLFQILYFNRMAARTFLRVFLESRQTWLHEIPIFFRFLASGPPNVSSICFFDPSVIGDVFSLSVDSVDLRKNVRKCESHLKQLLYTKGKILLNYIEIQLRNRVVSILVDNTLGSLEILGFGFRIPPFGKISIRAELSSLYETR